MSRILRVSDLFHDKLIDEYKEFKNKVNLDISFVEFTKVKAKKKKPKKSKSSFPASIWDW